MKIYFDADCGICNKCKNLVLFFTPPARQGGKQGGEVEFLDMNESKYKHEIEKTILVVYKNKEYRYGAALKQIFKKLIFPINLIGYLPIFLLTFLYIILRELRKKFSKKICKVE